MNACFCCVRFIFLPQQAKRLAWGSVSEMTYFVSGLGKCLWNDLFCVERDVKLWVNHRLLYICMFRRAVVKSRRGRSSVAAKSRLSSSTRVAATVADCWTVPSTHVISCVTWDPVIVVHSSQTVWPTVPVARRPSSMSRAQSRDDCAPIPSQRVSLCVQNHCPVDLLVNLPYSQF